KDQFPPRELPLPQSPRLALAYGNLFDEKSLEPVRQACEKRGIELHVAGVASGSVTTDPAPLLARYDLVFAKARAAIEAMAVGAAVVLCVPGRLGPMVNSRNFAELRKLNFGIRTLSKRLSVSSLEQEIASYDAADAAVVSSAIRQQCELQGA